MTNYDVISRYIQEGAYTFRLQGALYHCISAILPDINQENRSAQLYITDSFAALDGRMNIFQMLN